MDESGSREVCGEVREGQGEEKGENQQKNRGYNQRQERKAYKVNERERDRRVSVPVHNTQTDIRKDVAESEVRAEDTHRSIG